MTVIQNGVEINLIWIGKYVDGFALVRREDWKYNHIGKDGNLLSKTWWECAYSFSEGFSRVEKNGRWNEIDTTGCFRFFKAKKCEI